MKSKWICLLLLAGSFFLGGFGGRVPAGVTVNGVAVGGLPRAEAVRAVRSHIADGCALTVHTPAGEVRVALDFIDDVPALLCRAKRGGSYRAAVRAQWAEMEEGLLRLCEENARAAEDAALTFSREGFSYTEGRWGVACDYAEAVRRAAAAVKAGGGEIELPCRPYAPAVTEQVLRARTQLLASFSTRYSTKNLPRSHNIALAAERISGTVVGAGEEFSFNEVVGKRTVENGFSVAAVISDGAYVQGVGGGVCQASSTLFGAALRAGMAITESRPHSLSVGYVAPSQDAMVSEYSDLKFKNPHTYPVYLLAEAQNGRVTFEIYGLPDGRRYEVVSKVLFTLDPPPKKIVEGSENRTVRQEQSGLASESYLVVYEGERECARTLIRRDTYACVQGIEERAAAEVPEEAPEPPEEAPQEETPEEAPAEVPSAQNVNFFAGNSQNPCKSACFFAGIRI